MAKQTKRLHRNKEVSVGTTKPRTKKSFMNKLKEMLYPADTLLINMEMRNGFRRTLTIIAKKQDFRFAKGTYIVDPQFKYYNVDVKLWCLDYHQDIALPIDSSINSTALKVGLLDDPEVEIEHSIDPLTLQTFLTAKIAEGVMKGQAIDEYLRSMRMMLLIVTVTAVAHLMLFVFKSGMLNNVGVPF